MGLISFPPRPTGTDRSAQFMQWVWDSIKFLNQLNESQGTTSGRTTRGTFVIPQPSGQPGKGGAFDWEHKWVDKAYKKGAIVIREEETDFDDGTVCGTYIASTDISPGMLPPGIPSKTSGTDATFSLTITGGAITSVSITDGGTDYPVGATLPLNISGDGTGASGHVTIDLTGVVVDWVIDSGGSGYTSATASVPKVANWEDFALNHEHKRVLRNGVQTIYFTVRDGGLPEIRINADYTDDSKGSIQLDLNQLVAIAPDGHWVLKPTEWEVCISGETKHAVFLSTDSY